MSTLTKLLVLVSSLATIEGSAQKAKMFVTGSAREGYVVYAANQEWYPVSMKVEFNNTGLVFSGKSRDLFLVPPRADSFRIGTLSPEQGATRFALRYNCRYAMGDVALRSWNRDYVYDLPFGKGSAYTLYQGYNGAFSHAGEKALDFTMPEGTPVLSVREGIVVQVEQLNSRSCASADCKQYNNYIIVLHPDGTFAYYGHLRQNGSRVQPGTPVRKGDIIAESGNTGWSNGPHLHLAIFTGGFDKWNTIATRFQVGSGGAPVSLAEGKTYSRDY